MSEVEVCVQWFKSCLESVTEGVGVNRLLVSLNEKVGGVLGLAGFLLLWWWLWGGFSPLFFLFVLSENLWISPIQLIAVETNN